MRMRSRRYTLDDESDASTPLGNESDGEDEAWGLSSQRAFVAEGVEVLIMEYAGSMTLRLSCWSMSTLSEYSSLRLHALLAQALAQRRASAQQFS